MALNLLLVIIGLIGLTVGGEAVVRGALAAGQRLGVSPLLAGLVIVGFGTSAPELVVSVTAALEQRPDIAVGNVVGSNIGNVLLILGVCATITPLTITPLALVRDGLSVVGASILFLVLVWGSALVRWDAAILLAALVGYLVWAYLSERRPRSAAGAIHRQESAQITKLPTRSLTIGLTLLAGLFLLVMGSRALLQGAVGMAGSLGVSETVIGLTLVAVGTSFPEFAVSLLAALRRQADVAVGNILGSNLFNLLGILGLSALLQPLPISPRMLLFDQWVMLASALLLLLVLYTGHRISRVEGAILVASYAAYVAASFTVF